MFETIRLKLSKSTYYPWLIFISVTTATFMSNVDSSVLNVALPILEKYFNEDIQIVQWVVLSYLLVITGLLPVVGKLSDMIGRKIIFIFGLAVFVVASVLSAISINIIQLIIFRAIQGIGGSIMQGNVMSIVANTFCKKNRGKALGAIGSVVAIGTITGPALGGFLIHNFGWKSIFWINLPIGLIGIIGTLILLPKDNKAATNKLDLFGSIMFFISMVSLLFFLSNGKSIGFFSIIGVSLLIIGISTLLCFIFWELKIDNPLIDLTFFKIPTFTIGNIAGFISFILIMFPSILIPLYLQNILNYEPNKIGVIMATQALAMFIIAPFSGHLSDKIGYQIPSVIGMIVSTISLFMLGNLTSTSQPWFIVISIILFGIGSGFFQSPNNVSVLESVPLEKSGITGSIIATVRNFGRVTGVSITILLFSLFYKENELNYNKAISYSFYISSIISLLNVLLISRRIKYKNQKT